jgi:peptide/nickel transport system substrate-binding protein
MLMRWWTMHECRFNLTNAILAIAAIIVGLIFIGCSVTLAASDQNLIIGEVWAMGGIDPALYSYNLNNFLVAEGLTSISPEFEIVPCIAKSWETIDDDTWRFHLDEDVLFHDGSKVTADDVSEALKRTIEMNPSVKGQLNIKDITKVDDNTVDITTETPDASLPARLAYGRASIYRNNEESDGSISKPICTGPFKFVSYDKASDTLELAKNENYRDGAPLLDTVTVKFGIGDANAREMAIESGEIDFTTEPPLGSTARLQDNPDLNVTINLLCQGYKLKFGDVSKAPYDDVRVRKAIAYAIDRESIADDILLGRGKASDGNALTPGLAWRNNEIEGYSYNVEEAKSLLAEAGWEDTDGDGILDKDGQAFKITLYTWPQRPALPLIEQAVQSQLKEIGIEAEARVMESDAISERAGEWGMIWVGGGDACMMIPDPSYYIENEFLSTEVDYHYANPEVDDLILEARSTFDSEKRNDLYKQVQKIVYDEDCAQIPIAYHYLCVVTKNDVKGYVPNPAHHDYCINTGIYRE